ncbi:uncharacterized protein LOC131165098 [Malania oleifera]|uniref:uncharacterized protein LOC131165098 n=1 Tax=Malania oleifera TaxID=397392 RepID=UPI0025ADFFC7|nr:uncharacterized protein LOC131165098 [Malania oleifera]
MESSSISVERRGEGFRIENPFALKVGQVFTGFGVGCGVGIGVGRPLNVGAIPVLNQVMTATRGATDAFSGVGRHVNSSLRKLGAKSIEAGIGCGLGFGHGFGVGIAVKPGVVNQVQSCVLQAMAKMMMKFGIAPNLSIGQGVLPVSLQGVRSLTSEPSNQNPMGSFMQLATKIPEYSSQALPKDGNLSVVSTETSASKSTPIGISVGNQSEKVISSFLQNPVLKEENNDLVAHLQSENNMLHMVLKHQQIIEKLIEENEKLRQILVEDLKIPVSKIQASNSGRNRSPCSDCFECRRKQRKNR